MRYEERVVDEVQSLNDIVEVVSGFIPLKRSGRTFKALCPFHQEKTPSFIVHPEKQIFHCFGCGAGGNVFTFLMKTENLTFPEALRQLAERVHYPLPEPARRSPEEVSESEALYEIYRAAQEYYAANLRHPVTGEAARAYLRKRGFDEDVLNEFPLGWATAEWRGLFELLVRRGIKEPFIYRSGLILRSREGNPYDLFRGRLIFPIQNLQGKVIAFGGRALGEEMPKYLNSPESAIFRKRRELFGLHLTKRFIPAGEPRILIVEGYFDFLRVYRAGFKNVAATLGTALTEDQVRVLKRFVQEAVVIFDGDRAGEAASLRGLEVFLEGEMSAKVVVLPPGKDPDTLIGEAGAEAFGDLLAKALDFFDFKWQFLKRRYHPSEPMGLLKISSEFLETLSKVRSPLLLDHYLRRLATLLGIGEEAVRKELGRLQEKKRSGEEVQMEGRARTLPSFPEEGTLLALLLEEPAFWERGGRGLVPGDFRHPGAQEAFQILKSSYEGGTNLASHQVLNRLQDESIQSFISAHSITELTREEKEKAFQDCLQKIKQRRTGEKLGELRRLISDAEERGQSERVHELLEAYRLLLRG